MVNDRDELRTALRAVADDSAHPAVVRTTVPAAVSRRAFVFPGQGGQRAGMGRLFYESVAAFRVEVDRCDDTFRELFGESPVKYLLDDRVEADDSARVVQPALFMQMVGLSAMWRSVGIEPDIVVGHSQGEIAAAYVSGKMTLADAILIVGTRAQAVDKIASDEYAMAVVAAARDECEELFAQHSGWAELSVINSPRMVGISGDRGAVQDVVDILAERGRFTRTIRVRYPAHTGLVNGFRDDLRAVVADRLANQHFLDTDIDCVGATLGGPITPNLPVDEYWFWNLRNIVRFDKAVAAALTREVDTFVELAEHPTLQLSVQENLDALAADRAMTVLGTSSRTATDLSEFTRNLAHLAVCDLGYAWECLRTEPDSVRLPLRDFPNVRMNEQRLWLPYNSIPTDRIESATAPADTEPGTETAPPQLLVENWTRLVQRSLVSPRAVGIIDHTGGCTELAAALCAEAQRHGATARLLDIETDSGSGDIDTIVVLMPGLPDMDAETVVAETVAFFAGRRWWRVPGAGVADYWLVTVGGEAVLADDALPHIVHAAVGAGFRCIGTEHPGIALRHLDLGLEQSRPEGAAAIMAALHTADESELALRDGGLYAKRLTEADHARVGVVPASVPEHVVIVGGTGSLGLEFCEHYTRRGARQITLVSRSGETRPVAERLRRIRQTGSAEIRVASCDVGDEAAVQRSADEYRTTPANLIIHAAVDSLGNADLELADIVAAHVDQSLRAKFVGITNVVNSFARADDCRVVLCSSLVATLGGRGKIVYAAANRMLDAFALRLRADGLDCVSVQWGRWAAYRSQDESEAAKLAGMGYLSMRSADAIALGLGGFRENAIVAAFDWARGLSVLDAYGHGPLLSHLVTPEVVTVSADDASVGAVDVEHRLVRLLAEVIGADDLDTIDNTRSLVAVGLDSLQALEFRRRVNAELHYDLPVTELIGGASLDDVVRLLGARPAAAPGKSVGTTDPVVPSPSRRVAAARHDVSTEPPTSDDTAERARAVAERVVPGDLDYDRMRSARSDVNIFGLQAMMAALGPALRDGGVHGVDEIATRLAFAPRHRWLLRQWLHELTAHGCLDHDPNRGYRYLLPVPTPARADLFDACADLGYPRAMATFFTRADEHLIELAQDRVRVQELLFPDGDMLTAEAAYRENLISRYLNLAAGVVVADIVARLRRDRSPVRILELGAGVGGTTDEVAAALSGLPVDYHFTDVSTFFLNVARKRFADYPWMRFGIMDMNADLGRRQPRYDVVLAANVLHNAQHAGQLLRQVHDQLNPGGAVVFIEACRAHSQLLTSVHFLMSPRDDQPHPGLTDVRAGTDRIFLEEHEWLDELTAAGLTPMLMLPDADHPLSVLDQRIFAAVRD